LDIRTYSVFPSSVGYSVLNIGYSNVFSLSFIGWIFRVEYWIFLVGYWILDIGYSLLDIGYSFYNP